MIYKYYILKKGLVMEKKKYLLIEIPTEMHRRLKMAAAQKCITVNNSTLKRGACN